MDWLQNSLITTTIGKDYFQTLLRKRSLDRLNHSYYAFDTDYDAMLRAPVMTRRRKEKSTMISRKPLMNWSEIPEWMRFNPYILTGYRPPNGSYRTSLQTIGELHNESSMIISSSQGAFYPPPSTNLCEPLVNIWTHLFGLVITSSLFIHYLLDDKWNSLAETAYAPMSVYFICCISCLTCSCVYHTFASHSKGVAVTCHCIDYVSIVLQGT